MLIAPDIRINMHMPTKEHVDACSLKPQELGVRVYSVNTNTGAETKIIESLTSEFNGQSFSLNGSLLVDDDRVYVTTLFKREGELNTLEVGSVTYQRHNSFTGHFELNFTNLGNYHVTLANMVESIHSGV